MLFGETDVGKTFVALNLAIAVCADLPWQGHAVADGTVLFIEAKADAASRSASMRRKSKRA